MVSKWRERYKQKGLVLKENVQYKLIKKFTELTNQKDPYLKIVSLELENEWLQKEVEALKYEKDNLLNMLQQQLERE